MTTSFRDGFDDGTYTDKWTVAHNDGTITESESSLHMQIPEPAEDCDKSVLDSETTFSGQNLTIEAKVKPNGYGAVYLSLKKDSENIVRFGFNTDDVQYVQFGVRETGPVSYTHLRAHET